MDRKSIVAFVAIYALVAGVGFIASHRNGDVSAQPTADAVESRSPESTSIKRNADQE